MLLCCDWRHDWGAGSWEKREEFEQNAEVARPGGRKRPDEGVNPVGNTAGGQVIKGNNSRDAAPEPRYGHRKGRSCPGGGVRAGAGAGSGADQLLGRRAGGTCGRKARGGR